MTRILLVTLVAVLMATLAVTVQAEIPQKPAVPKNITLELTDTTVAEAVQRLFKDTKLSFILQPGVMGTISSLSLKDVPFDNALNSLVKAAGLEVSQDEGVYIIGKNLSKSETTQTSVVVRSNVANENQVQAQPLPEEMQEVMPANYPAPYPQQGYPQVPDQPVYYGPYTPQGYYYNPGYSQGYNQYPRMITPPAYQPYRPNILPGPGTVWSTGIGPVKIVRPEQNNK